MTKAFDYFVILAEMRTGSNLLEATLTQVDGLHCHGEAFNPDYVGSPKLNALFGMSMADRLKDPLALLHRIRSADGFNGFRFFFDHEPRVVDAILNDPRCAKIVLTRNPVDCYISLKIAYNTKRWQLTDVKDKIAWKPPFKPAEFEAFLQDRQEFQIRIQNALQITGQTAFYMDYEDSLRPEVINGLLKHLGFEAMIDSVADTLVRQNPEEMADKVRNFPEMEAALQRIDWSNLARTPNFEPRRGPGVPRFIAAAGAPLLYMPIQPLGDGPIRDWLSRLGKGGLAEDFTQKTLRAWMRKAPGHRSFTVIRHPLTRAHDIFAAVLDRDGQADLRRALRAQYDVALPPDEELAGMSASDYRAALLGFLRFLKVNLNGQTPHRQDMLWASQWTIIQGFAQFAPPDLLCREDRLEQDLAFLCRGAGVKSPPQAPRTEPLAPVPLAAIHDDELEDAARDAYPRDYVTFGFSRWKPLD
ncbi:nodulation protein NodH [Defluviimonas sp. WL0050]|uniref:Nodulation protein NodH n=1 Tax=Albidovulum litorale TaxID=2984134 RepID=A0ABT2ZRR0_9RHOB|nr:nodulation protein NodH [Defluviimonas sp. WL0050]MCV2873829.1 nodulation protein NodH [Defluviimonas sp. WL0050]